MKNSFRLKSKMPFIRDLFQPNLHYFWNIFRKCKVPRFGHPTEMRGEIVTKNTFGLKTKAPFINRLISTKLAVLLAHQADSAKFDVSVILLQ